MVQVTAGTTVLVFGAGASLAAPAGRPLFGWIRAALLKPVDAEIAGRHAEHLAPEALLSRLANSGIDIDRELRQMLSGGAPNALHLVAAETLRRGWPVWTTNFDELTEDAARSSNAPVHVIGPDDDPTCRCKRGHLFKPHGTLSGTHVLARSEQVMRPLSPPWLDRIASDCADASVAVVGYAGADIDLRGGLRAALMKVPHHGASWFARNDDVPALQRRYAEPLAANRLTLRASDRPDLAALAWARAQGLTALVTDTAQTDAERPTQRPPLQAAYQPNALIRARVLDDFGAALDARTLYRKALRSGPRRAAAARAVFTSGMIHGAPWRTVAVASLNLACRLPVSWAMPHRARLNHLTWNVPVDERLAILERSLLRVPNDPKVLLATANAAKEVDPQRSAELVPRARAAAERDDNASDAAWATWVHSFSLRWLADIEGSLERARQLADGYDALAGPVWIAWGHFELGANAALQGHLEAAIEEMQLAIEVFEAAGPMFLFDAWAAMIAIRRAAGDMPEQRHAYDEARQLLQAGSLRRAFRQDVLTVEQAEYARQQERYDDAERLYRRLTTSPTVAQEILGLLGLGEVQRRTGRVPEASWQAMRRSDELGFGYGQVHAAVTLALAGETTDCEAEAHITASTFQPPTTSAPGLLRYAQGAEPDQHVLCFP
jgi:hypothetical protein